MENNTMAVDGPVYVVGRSGETGRPAAAAGPFAGTTAVTLAGGLPPGIDVYAAVPGGVRRLLDAEAGRAVYLVGRVVSRSGVTGDDLLRRAAAAADGPDPAGLLDLLGTFVLIVDDRRRRRVSFATDVLGLWPWFVGTAPGPGGPAAPGDPAGRRLVAGTDVLGICDAGLSTGEVDYDSVGSWLTYNFVCTGGSVVRDYRRAAGGTVATFDPAGRPAGEVTYAPLRYERRVVPADELVAGLHERVRRSFDLLTRDVDEVNLPLSGGHDSRLLCALAAGRDRPRVDVVTVESRPQEAAVARRVAEALGLRHRVLPVGPSLMDLHDDPLYFQPEGFPTPRNLTHYLARLRPGVPVLSGFLGDVVMKGPSGGVAALLAKEQTAPDDDGETLGGAAHDYFRAQRNRLHLLRDPVGPRATARGRAAMVAFVRNGRETGRPLAQAYLRLRQRMYIAGIVLGHREVADALLPFYDWELIHYHTHHVGSFAADTYAHLFRRYFPALAEIPHESAVAGQGAVDGPARHLRTWAARLLRRPPADWARSAITPHKLLKRLPWALLTGGGKHHHEIGYLHRVHAFERRARRANLRLDWSRM